MATPAPLLKEIKPRNARSKRALAARASLINENPKTTLFLRGTSTSLPITTLLADLATLKKPHSIRFNKKNAIHPFEDASSLEFFCQKNDASLLVFGSHSKKRPHCMTVTRMFGGKVLDMMEFLCQDQTFRGLTQFSGRKAGVGMKPLIAFQGAVWEDEGDSETAKKFKVAKSLFLDLFKGEETQTVDVEGLQYMVTLSAGEVVQGQPDPLVRLRVYLIKTKKSGQRLPRVELEEMGPRVDMRIGRYKEAEEAMMKEAMKKSKVTEPKTKKNIETDIIGDKMGRIHLGRQDLSTLQTRKMKGLKRDRDIDSEPDDMDSEEDMVSSDDEAANKRRKDIS